MRNTKTIDPSLDKKITENERRIHNLFNSGLYKSESMRTISIPYKNPPIPRNIRHKKNMSQDEVYINSFNNNHATNFKSTIDTTTPYKTIQSQFDEDSNAFINRMGKRIKITSNNNNQDDKSNKIFYTTFNNVYQKLKNKNSKKVFNRNELNNICERLYNNDYKTKKQPYKEKHRDSSTIDFSIKTDETPMKKQYDTTVDVDDMIERFEEDIKRRNEKLEKKRAELKKNEKKLYPHKPKLNKNNKKYDGEIEDNFLERQKKYDEQRKKKEEKYKEELKKKEKEISNITNYIYKKQNKKDKDKEEKKDEKANRKESVDKTIKSLYDWESQRKKKIEKKQKEKNGVEETKFDYKPKINKMSNSLAKQNRRQIEEPDVFSRLSKEDKILKEKKRLLIDLYTPSFKPNVLGKKDKRKLKRKSNENIVDINLENEKRRKRRKKKKRDKSSSNSEEDNEEEDEEDEDNEEDEQEEENEEEFDYKQDPKVFTEDDVQDQLRKALLRKMRK